MNKESERLEGLKQRIESFSISGFFGDFWFKARAEISTGAALSETGCGGAGD
jgi:hypothetical protein